MKGITFIGMAGSGKSAVGVIVAGLLNWKFVDLDKLILETEKISHHEFMKLFGGQALSDLEQRLTLGLDFDNTVFAPPGSMVYSVKGMEKIKQNSFIVYLRTTPDIVKQRLGERLYKNGIIGLKEKGLPKLMEERAILYEKYADYTFDTSLQTKEEMANIVIAGLKKAGVAL